MAEVIWASGIGVVEYASGARSPTSSTSGAIVMLIPSGADAPDVVPLDVLLVDALPPGGRAVPGDPDVEPVLLELEPVQAVTNDAMVAPTAVPVSLDRLFVMIISRL